ncbi:DUF4145 domain-containing protein [Serratia liquefaciens]|uniref:DUF4145 domain-containing protein n=1 Tax=Serratia liquefaciens TaxID=614 RepID=UPI002183358D|nr:DUF4145 domain-containing protein [Serratia liquefaciens]CAI2431668.1 Uncharacterised protein [Serratia liquefaciens]
MENANITEAQMHLQMMNMRFLEEIREEERSFIDCPHCNASKAVLDWESLNKHETVQSIKERSNIHWESDWLEYKYSANYKCISCDGITISSGDVKLLELGGIDIETGEEDYEDVYFYHPRYFTPALNLMQIPRQCPREVKELLFRSFQIAFCDHSAAANRLRVALEFFTRLHLEDSDFKLTLHKRLAKLEERLKESASLSTAIRIIGNQGSHEGDDVPEYLLAFAYKAFEQMLIDLYGDRKATTYELAKLFERK